MLKLTMLKNVRKMLKIPEYFDYGDSTNTNGNEFKITSIKDEIKNTLDELKNNPINKMTKEEIRKQNEKVFGEN